MVDCRQQDEEDWWAVGGLDVDLFEIFGGGRGGARKNWGGGLMVVSGTRPPLKNENSSDLGLFKLKMSKIRRKNNIRRINSKKSANFFLKKRLGIETNHSGELLCVCWTWKGGGLSPPCCRPWAVAISIDAQVSSAMVDILVVDFLITVYTDSCSRNLAIIWYHAIQDKPPTNS